jgi:hypothetical protein
VRAALRGLPEEDGQATGGVEVANVEGGGRVRVAFALWRKGVVPGRLSLEVDLGGCRAAEALVGLEDGVVEEPEADPVLEVVPKEDGGLAPAQPEQLLGLVDEEQQLQSGDVAESPPELRDRPSDRPFRDELDLPDPLDELVASGSPRPM